MRQQGSTQEHFRRGNAIDALTILIVAAQTATRETRCRSWWSSILDHRGHHLNELPDMLLAGWKMGVAPGQPCLQTVYLSPTF